MKSLVWYLVILMSVLSFVPHAEGSFVPSEAINTGSAQRYADIGKIETVLEEKLVSRKLEDLGFSSKEIKERLSRLSDRQVHDYAQKLDEIRAGGFHNGEGEYHYNINLLLVILLIVLLIILIASAAENTQDHSREAMG